MGEPLPFWTEFEELKRETTSLVRGTSIGTFESQTQLDKLYSEPPNWAEEGWKNREAVAVFEVMANLAVAQEETPSLLDDEDDEMTGVRHVSKHIKLGSEKKGSFLEALNEQSKSWKIRLEGKR